MDFSSLPDENTLLATLQALNARNIATEVVDNRSEALKTLKAYLPDTAEVMTGSSMTLDQIGFTDLLKSGNHPWVNLKDGILTEKDPQKQADLRRAATLSQYFLGSVHAITRDGQVLVCSGSGSQIPSYSFSSPHVIWVAGAQKIVPDLGVGLRRIEEYCFPHEDKRMKALGAAGASLSQIWIVRKSAAGRIKLIFVKEVLGI